MAKEVGSGSGNGREDGESGGRAGEVLLAYLTEQVATIGAREAEVGSMDSDAIHKTRVATRRLRSVLASFGRLLHREQIGPLRDELRWFATVLGEVRDLHVLRERLRGEASDLFGLGGLPATAERELAERERVAQRQLHAALDSVRYAELRLRLDWLVREPPLRRRADRPAARVLPLLVGKAARGVDDAAARADAPDLSPLERDDLLHEVRKAAKRARYAAELALPVGGKGARRLVERMTQLQEVLGQHQDSVMSRRVLAELAQPVPAVAGTDAADGSDGADAAAGGRVLGPEDVFAAGFLAGHEEAADDATTGAAYRKALRAVTRSKVRGWTQAED